MTNLFVKRYPTCEVGVDDGNGNVENCGEPAYAWIKFEDDGSALNVCLEHLQEIQRKIDESEE